MESGLVRDTGRFIQATGWSLGLKQCILQFLRTVHYKEDFWDRYEFLKYNHVTKELMYHIMHGSPEAHAKAYSTLTKCLFYHTNYLIINLRYMAEKLKELNVILRMRGINRFDFEWKGYGGVLRGGCRPCIRILTTTSR